MKKNLLSLILLSQLFFPLSILAQQAVVYPGSKPGTNSGLLSLSTGNTIRVRSLKDRSMYCRYRSGAFIDIAFSNTIGCNSGTCPTGRLIGDAEGGLDRTIGENDAISFIANDNPSDEILPVDSYYTLTLTEVNPDPSDIILECFNTTLYGNFNTVTVANPFNFLELTNDSNLDINARIVVTKNDGTELARLNISVPQDQQRDIAIHDIAGAANTFGRILVAHDGALHGLRAKLTKYTSSFAITASDKFETRENEQ